MRTRAEEVAEELLDIARGMDDIARDERYDRAERRTWRMTAAQVRACAEALLTAPADGRE